MDPVVRHSRSPDVSFDGGDLDCGSGLLLPVDASELTEWIDACPGPLAAVEEGLAERHGPGCIFPAN